MRQSESNIETNPSTLDLEKPMQDQDEVRKARQERLVEVSEDLDTPDLSITHREQVTGESATKPLAKNRECNYFHDQAKKSNPEEPSH